MSFNDEIMQKVTRQDKETKGFRTFLYGLDANGNPAVAKVDSDGNVYTTPMNYGTVGTGRKVCASAGTREQFSAQACKMVMIQAEDSNTGDVVIGGAAVVEADNTRQGINVYPGAIITLYVSNMNLLYLDSEVSGDGVHFMYFN